MACQQPSCVLVFTAGGDFETSINKTGIDPEGVAVDADGFVYVCIPGLFTSEVLVY